MASQPIDYAQPGIQRRPRKFWPLWVVLVIVVSVLAFSLIAPVLNTHEEPSLRVVCASNLRQIGQGIAMYANDNGGLFPDDLKTLLENEDLTTKAFVCPSSHDTPAAEGPTTRATANNMMKPGHLSYIYIGRGFHASDVLADAVIAYEPLSNHGDGMNVLFGDFHVEWLPTTEAKIILKQVADKRSPVRYPLTQPATTLNAG